MMKNRIRRAVTAVAIAGLTATTLTGPAMAAEQPILKSGKNAVQRVEAQVEKQAGHNLVDIEFPEDANNVAHLSQAEEFNPGDEELVQKIFEALDLNGFNEVTYLPTPVEAVLPLGPAVEVDPEFSVVAVSTYAGFIDPEFSVIPLQEIIDPGFSVAGPDGLPLRGDDSVKTIYRPDAEEASPTFIQGGRLAVNRVKFELEQAAGHEIVTLDFDKDDHHAVTVRKAATFEESDQEALDQIFEVLKLNGFDKINFVGEAETAEELPAAEFPIA